MLRGVRGLWSVIEENTGDKEVLELCGRSQNKDKRPGCVERGWSS